MREFVYYSKTAPTIGAFGDDYYQAGRLDIALHSLIAAFFLSHSFREDVKMHLIFDGPTDPPKHLELKPVTDGQTGVDKIYLNKRDMGWIIKKMLYKYKKGEKHEVFPGYWIEKKPLINVIKDLQEEGKTIYVLDKGGEDIRNIKIDDNSVFVLGDHQGLGKQDLKKLKKISTSVSVGNRTYFASQTIAILNNELDRREDFSNQS